MLRSADASPALPGAIVDERVRRGRGVDDAVAEPGHREGEQHRTRAARRCSRRRARPSRSPSPPRPSASVAGPPRRRISDPDAAPPRAKGIEKARNSSPVSSTLVCRTNSSDVGTSTITTPDPQFESVASAVPSRKESERVDRGGHERILRSAPPRHDQEEHRAESDRHDGAGFRPPGRRRVLDPADREPDPEHQQTEPDEGHGARVIGTERRHQYREQRDGNRQQHDVHAEERPPRPRLCEEAGHQRSARAADPAERAPDTDCDRLLVALEHRVDGGQRRGEATGRRDALQRATEDHQGERVGDRAQGRRDTEPDHPGEQERAGARRGRPPGR